MNTPDPTGTILNIQRLSTEDGPGIRTTVFFKGCPLHCDWCHNPESILRRLQTQWFSVRCINCQTCVKTCPNGCLSMTKDGLAIDRERCESCGQCAAACPSGALEALGKTMTVEELLAELVKDRAFYEKSRGGVTLSGGEPAHQPDFSEALLFGLKAQGISTALDTCGLCAPQVLGRLIPHTDLVLYDLKLFDEELHQYFTGLPNRYILGNLISLCEYKKEQVRDFSIWIRTPLIPGVTASEQNLTAIGRFLAERPQGSIARWELCAFNNLCRDQYKRLGQNWTYANTPLMTRAELNHWEEIAKASGIRPELVVATGATRVEELQ